MRERDRERERDERERERERSSVCTTNEKLYNSEINCVFVLFCLFIYLNTHRPLFC